MALLVSELLCAAGVLEGTVLVIVLAEVALDTEDEVDRDTEEDEEEEDVTEAEDEDEDEDEVGKAEVVDEDEAAAAAEATEELTAAATGAPPHATSVHETGTLPALFSAMRANAGSDKSTAPFLHSGHLSTIFTTMEPLGPVTEMHFPQKGLMSVGLLAWLPKSGAF
jgi:hypothetical protein